MSHNHDLNDRCDMCREWPDWWLDLAIRINDLGVQVTEAQNDIDADTTVIQALSGSLDTIEAGIDALKSSTDGTVDTSALDGAIADLKSKVDAAVTDVTPAAPVDTPPADGAPVGTDSTPVGSDVPVGSTDQPSETPIGDAAAQAAPVDGGDQPAA